MSVESKRTNSLSITGVGAICGLGTSVEQLDCNLQAATEHITPESVRCSNGGVILPLPTFNFEHRVSALEIPKEVRAKLLSIGARYSPPIQAVLLVCAEAINMRFQGLIPQRTGLIIAGSNLTNEQVVSEFNRHQQGKRVRPSYAAEHMDSFLVGLCSEIFGITGEGYTVGAASASGGVAISMARRAILSGDLDTVVVLGVPTLLLDSEMEAFHSISAMHQGEWTDYQPFSSTSRGFVYGQSAAAIILDASPVEQAPPLAKLVAASMKLDGHRGTAPNAEGELTVMREALKQAGITKDEIDLINCHGTGTPLGDQTELVAISRLLDSAGNCHLNSSKAFVGHNLACAGVLEAVICVLQLQSQYQHANPRLHAPIRYDLNWTPVHVQRRPMRHILSNSFGFAGINTTQIFQRTQQESP